MPFVAHFRFLLQVLFFQLQSPFLLFVALRCFLLLFDAFCCLLPGGVTSTSFVWVCAATLLEN